MGLAQRAERQFMWNGHLLKDFLTPQLKRFSLPLVHGCKHLIRSQNLGFDILNNLNPILFPVISINQVNLGSTFTWALISRRSVQRAGTRLYCRGIDKTVSFSIVCTFWK